MTTTINRRKVSFLCLLLAAPLGSARRDGTRRRGRAILCGTDHQGIEASEGHSRPYRGARDPARAAENDRFIETLRNRTTRSLTSNERTKIASIAKERPSIDLEINFEFNSSVIRSSSMSQITALGEALTSADLKGRTFVLAGHTDATGDAATIRAFGTPLGCGQALPGREVRHRGQPFGDGRTREDATEEFIQSLMQPRTVAFRSSTSPINQQKRPSQP